MTSFTPGALAPGGDSDAAINDNSRETLLTGRSGTGGLTAASRFTLEVWTNGASLADGAIMSYGGRSVGTDFNTTRVVVSSDTTSIAIGLTRALGEGVWHLVDVTYDGTTASVYEDGQLQGSSRLANGGAPESDTLAISGSAGHYDEFAVYDHVLSADRILAHYLHSGAAGPIGGAPAVSENAYNNPSEPAACSSQGHSCAPVNTESGVFSHTFTDLVVPGRGVPLGFSHSYNSFAAGTDSPLGFGWSEPYSTSLRVDGSGNARVTQENGSQVVFTNNTGTLTPPPRVIATLVKHGDGSYTFTRGAKEVFDFNASGQMVDQKDLNGYTTTLAYVSGRLSTVTDAAGRKLTFTWRGSHVTKVTDPLARSVSFAYDSSGDLTDVTDVAGGNTHFAYNASHLLSTMRMPNQNPAVSGDGSTVTNVYTSGRVTSQTDQLGRRTAFVYAGDNSSAAGGTTTNTDPKGNVVVETYSFGERTAVTKGSGTSFAATWTYGYDPATLGATSVTDPNGHTSLRTYDASGNMLTSTDAMGHTTSNSYDRLNDLLTTTDPLGVTTTMRYDAAGNLLTRSRPLTGGSTG